MTCISLRIHRVGANITHAYVRMDLRTFAYLRISVCELSRIRRVFAYIRRELSRIRRVSVAYPSCIRRVSVANFPELVVNLLEGLE